MPDLWRDGRMTLPFWATGSAYTIVPGRHIGLDQAPIPGGQPWDVPALVAGRVVLSVQTSAIGRVTVVDTGRSKRRFISYCHEFYGNPAPTGTNLKQGARTGRLALANESPGSAWLGVHCHVVVHDNMYGAFSRVGDTYYDPATEIANYLASPAGGGATPLEEDMPLDATTDYEAFKTMLQRALVFDIRPGGAGADARLGRTLWEQLNGIEKAASTPITADQVKAIADQVVKAIGTPSAVVDYAAIAKAVNDDAARRLAS